MSLDASVGRLGKTPRNEQLEPTAAFRALILVLGA